ncbi:MAG: NAD(P)H-quinone oxidoreductase subunit 2, chloroplastic [Phycisphaerae bacterium]|nr:NAD(P)H-quinone oxidoreductase subunit 2, chloroplastic [Phycisphaerae bacterium]
MNSDLANLTLALLPEIILLVGACVLVLIFSGGRAAESRMGPGWFALVTVVAAAGALMALPTPVYTDGAIRLTPIALSARWASLLVGLLLIAANGLLPESRPGRDLADRAAPEFFMMLLASLAGLMVTAVANDLIVLLLALELTSVPTYIAVALSRPQAKATEAGGKYFFLGALSAALLLMGLAWLYGATGTTRLDEMVSLPVSLSPTALIAMGLAVAGLAFKIAAFPYHVYIADVYEGSAAPLAGWLAFVPKAAGLLALGKLLVAVGGPILLAGGQPGGWTTLPALKWTVWGLAAATMTVGNAMALWQKSIKRMLAYSSVAHSGYLLVALMIVPVDGQAVAPALLFYLLAYGVANLGAFMVLSSIRAPESSPSPSQGEGRGEGSRGDREAETFADLAGLARRRPALAIALAVFGFSLMGLPLTMGFVGKLYVFSAALRSGELLGAAGSGYTLLVIVALVNAAVGAGYYLRMIAACWLGEREGDAAPTVERTSPRGTVSHGAVIAVLAALTLAFGLAPFPLQRNLEEAPRRLAPPTTSASQCPAPVAASVADGR